MNQQPTHQQVQQQQQQVSQVPPRDRPQTFDRGTTARGGGGGRGGSRGNYQNRTSNYHLNTQQGGYGAPKPAYNGQNNFRSYQPQNQNRMYLPNGAHNTFQQHIPNSMASVVSMANQGQFSMASPIYEENVNGITNGLLPPPMESPMPARSNWSTAIATTNGATNGATALFSALEQSPCDVIENGGSYSPPQMQQYPSPVAACTYYPITPTFLPGPGGQGTTYYLPPNSNFYGQTPNGYGFFPPTTYFPTNYAGFQGAMAPPIQTQFVCSRCNKSQLEVADNSTMTEPVA